MPTYAKAADSTLLVSGHCIDYLAATVLKVGLFSICVKCIENCQAGYSNDGGKNEKLFDQYERLFVDYPVVNIDDGSQWLNELKDIPRRLSQARFDSAKKSRLFFNQSIRCLGGALRHVRDVILREIAPIPSVNDIVIALHVNTNTLRDSFAKYFTAISSGSAESDPVCTIS